MEIRERTPLGSLDPKRPTCLEESQQKLLSWSLLHRYIAHQYEKLYREHLAYVKTRNRIRQNVVRRKRLHHKGRITKKLQSRKRRVKH